MPEQVPIPELPPKNLHDPAEPLRLADDPLGAAASLSLVLQTMAQYEAYRHNNFDPKWNTADLLYFGWRPRLTWDGTNVPRSSLGIPLVFDQVETAFPKIFQAFFYDPDWFDVVPDAGGDATAARDVRDTLLYYLEQDSGAYGMSAKMDIALAIQSVLLYGTGALAVEWDEVRRRPLVSWVDVRDLYLDPACAVPWVDGCRAVIRRRFMTVDELAALREDPRMNIPPDEILYTLSQFSYYSPAETTKATQDVYRGVVTGTHQFDQSPNPAGNRIEVLVYYSQHRIIWILGRKHVAYSASNPYGFIPIVVAPCYNVLGKIYGLGIADVQESNQRVAEGLLNGRLDEINLMLHPPRAQRRGVILTPSQQRWRPGAVFQVSDPKDIMLLTPQATTTEIYRDLQYIEMLADRRTGVNTAMLGVPRPSNANRTAGGVQAQLSAGTSRLQKIVMNIETCMLLPLLYKLYRIIQYHTIYTDVLPAVRRGSGGEQQEIGLSPGQPEALPGPAGPPSPIGPSPLPAMPMQPEILSGTAPGGGEIRYVSAEVFRRPIKFRIMAADKLAARDKLGQMFSFVSQMVFNGPFIERLNETGYTIDFNEFLAMFQDITGTSRRYNLFRTMTPQEQQQYIAARQQPPQPSEKIQVAQIGAETRLRMGELKAQTEIQKAEILAGAQDSKAQKEADTEREKLARNDELDNLRAELAEQRQKTEAIISAMRELMTRLVPAEPPEEASPESL